jgi:hypothetical protein
MSATWCSRVCSSKVAVLPQGVERGQAAGCQHLYAQWCQTLPKVLMADLRSTGNAIVRVDIWCFYSVIQASS